MPILPTSARSSMMGRHDQRFFTFCLRDEHLIAPIRRNDNIDQADHWTNCLRIDCGYLSDNIGIDDDYKLLLRNIITINAIKMTWLLCVSKQEHWLCYLFVSLWYTTETTHWQPIVVVSLIIYLSLNRLATSFFYSYVLLCGNGMSRFVLN